MTTLLLPPNEIAELRVLKGLAYLLAVMITLDRHHPGRAFTPDQVAMIAGIDARTAAKQLQDLSTLDRVILTTSGYVLTQGGRALFLAPVNNDLALSPDNTQALSRGNSSHALEAQALATPDLQDNAAHTVCVSLKKIEEEDLDLINNSSSSDSSKSTRSAQALRIGNENTWAINNLIDGETVPTVTGYTFEDGTPVYQMARADGSFITTREILDAVDCIEGFGEFSPGLSVDAIKPELALAWIAKAYDDRDSLRGKPVQLVYSRLRDVEKPNPPRKYFKDPARYLPDSYIEELRLKEYDCRSCVDAKFSTRSALEEHIQKMHLMPEEEDTKFAAAVHVELLDSEDPASKAWKTVLEALQLDMPRASFDNWVRDTRPVQYDCNVLTVGVRNRYACDWLESRLSDQLNTMLSGILFQGVTVRFVVAEVGDE